MQLIDLINTLKNIGADAITINEQRINNYSSIAQGVFNPPLVIKVIGDSELLYNSLNRSGGIIDQIGNGSVYIENNLVLPSI